MTENNGLDLFCVRGLSIGRGDKEAHIDGLEIRFDGNSVQGVS
jgi:hypothetical protein